MRVLGSAIALFVAGLAALAEEQPIKAEKNLAVEPSNAFACDLYNQLAAENPGANLFFSPYSVSSALGMTLEGARGDTALEMAKVLHVPNDAAAGLGSGFASASGIGSSGGSPNGCRAMMTS